MDTEAVNTMVQEVVKLLFTATKRELDYMLNCTEKVNKLRNEAEKLEHLRERVRQRINAATTKGEVLLVGVQDWVVKADNEISKSREFLEQEANAKKTCFNLRLCVNLRAHYYYGKKATKMDPSIVQCHDEGKTYESCVSLPAPALGFLQLYESKNLDDFTTQKSTFEEIMKAVKDEKQKIIGIYGLGGVGKTTLAKEVAAAVKNLFDDVVFITVSQKPDAKKIKEDVDAAARRVLSVNRDNILIILDDVWGRLKLEEVGIPCGSNHTNCKILLTSRSKDVCEAMDAQSPICLKPLQKKESWLLFKDEVGERVESDAELNPIARAVADQCGGLPLIIQAVGRALRNKCKDFWEAALGQLQKSAPHNIDPVIKEAFLSLELSYNCLESEEAKSCFLLCSLFPEDSSITMERLALYGVGLGKFKDLRCLDDARDRVWIAVSTLKSSFLLLDGKDKSEAKMHDVVLDVALKIASKDQGNFLVQAGTGLTEWWPSRDDLENCTAISLMKNCIRKLPDELDCPHLNTLLLQENSNLSTIPDEFIRGAKEVKVLDLERVGLMSQLPQSLALLTKLRMLNLGGNRNLKKICVLGDLKGLEILILRDTGIEEIPHQIGQLAYLRLLDVRGCSNLSHISPGVILKLHGLEELYIGYNSVQWENYMSLMWLRDLSRLTVVDLFVPDADLIPEDVSFEKFKRFWIEIGVRESGSDFPWELNSERHLILGTPCLEIPLLRPIEKLIQVASFLSLNFTENLNDIPPSLNSKGFHKLKQMSLYKCDNISCLVNTRDWGERQVFLSLERLWVKELRNLSEICSGCLVNDSFVKLHDIHVESCCKLQDIVSSNMPRVLHNITNVVVRFCDSVSCVFECKGLGGRKGEEKFLSKLEVLNLEYLPMMKAIWSCPDELISLSNLVTLRLEECSELRRLFSACVAQGLVHLRELDISGCDGMEEVIGGGVEETVRGEIGSIVFPCLQKISLSRLSKLTSFCSENHAIEYPSLNFVYIQRCERIKIWGHGSQDTPNLRDLRFKLIAWTSGKITILLGHGGINDGVREVATRYEAASTMRPLHGRIKDFGRWSTTSIEESNALLGKA